MNFCPRCGSKLGMKLDGGRERPACMAEGCRFVHFGDFSFGCGAVVLRDGKALLIQRGINPNRGAWQIPGGYVESDEEILSAVEREVLEESGVPCGPINDLADVFSDPQLLHRQMYLEMPHPTLGTIKQTGLPIKFSLTPGGLDRHPPLLGEHNQEILEDLGYSEADIKQLAEEAVI